MARRLPSALFGTHCQKHISTATVLSVLSLQASVGKPQQGREASAAGAEWDWGKAAELCGSGADQGRPYNQLSGSGMSAGAGDTAWGKVPAHVLWAEGVSQASGYIVGPNKCWLNE